MPLTFPSHAAAVLPLFHMPGTRRLPPLALVIGTTTPDLIYLFNTEGRIAHEPTGLLTFCLPAGLVAMVYFEGLLRPVVGPPLARLFPMWTRLPHLLTSPQYALPHDPTGWFSVCLALVVGAATHQLWDGFTHAWMWPARILYPDAYVSLLGTPVLVSKVIQHSSTFVGTLMVALYMLLRTREESPLEPPIALQPSAHERIVRVAVLPLLTSVIAAAQSFVHPHRILARAIWDAAWAASAAFVVTLGLVCLIVRLREALGDSPAKPSRH